MNHKPGYKKILFGTLVCLLAWSMQAQAGDARNINFAAFQKIQPGFKFDSFVAGKFSDFIQAMEGAQIVLLSHTSDAVDGDVINIQQDVLREGEKGMIDNGINCSLTLHIEGKGTAPGYNIGGLCRIFRTGDGAAEKVTNIIPSTFLPDNAQGFEGWIEVYEDQKNRIAFYSNLSTVF